MGLPRRLHTATPAELERRIAAEREGRPFLLFRDGGGAQRIVVLGERGSRLAVGRHPGVDVALPWDDEVSRLHAELACLGDEWTVADVGSRNGSYLNEERLDGRRRLRDGDVLRVGRTALAFFAPGDRVSDVTAPTREALAVPNLSAGQRRVLVALCRPYAEGGPGVPASNRRIADELVLSVETVKSHLRALFEAFGLEALPQNEKRATLARLAITRGIVTRQELAAPAPR